MNTNFLVISILFLFGLSVNAQYVPPIKLGDLYAYCNTYDNTTTVDSAGYTLNPGEVRELTVDVTSICSLYSRPDVSISTNVYFLDDPMWKKNKDQITFHGLKFEVIDVSTGQNMMDLVKNSGGQACNSGSGFMFTDVRQLSPMAMRPMLYRLSNVGRTSQRVAFGATYNNIIYAPCGDYPK